MQAVHIALQAACVCTQAKVAFTHLRPMLIRTTVQAQYRAISCAAVNLPIPRPPTSTRFQQAGPSIVNFAHYLKNRAGTLASMSTECTAASATTTAVTTAMSAGAACVDPGSISYLSQSDAASVDQLLMGPQLGFSVEQLMELAGLGVAAALAAEWGPQVVVSEPTSAAASSPAATAPAPAGTRRRRVLVLAGPGNNGGDGLVAARHLHHFGYEVKVCYPKPTDKPLYNGLVKQISSLGIPLLPWSALSPAPLAAQADVVVDALFGFSFSGQPRAPFDEIIRALLPSARPPPIVSVDVPSGWHVEGGDSELPPGGALQPDMLVSLTAPKLCARYFKGAHHYLGGRFVPPPLAQRFQLRLPPYPGAAMCVRIGGAEAGSAEQAAVSAAAEARRIADMRISYERGGLEEAAFSGRDPRDVFDEWFRAAVEGKVCEEPNAISLASCDSGGRPSVRVVLLKGYDRRGFVFYTNYSSRKGEELGNGWAAFSIYWEKLQRQIRVEGVVEKVPEAESTAYFHSRPRGSQVGAWVSEQSQPCRDRAELEARNAALQERFSDPSQPVPKPPHWGGFLIRPTSIEFWQGRPSRLHDRIRFRRNSPDDSDPWVMERLQP
ncbi:hypothetical protein Agub_g14081 [Astrephomene gubernaculifera]|uniref:NAD(P)H-hydrate epimerase n=1 Tax=Astrephomene gubernaculifera TaxID=47775 RepID=A0AAD3HS04_9CHLO|nr:hypothetical protein Agub_g14081 [Astrephomene gubernaculifera]